MFGNREQFEMGETLVAGVGDQAVGQFVIGQEAIAFAPPP